jgi:hypothetical protein
MPSGLPIHFIILWALLLSFRIEVYSLLSSPKCYTPWSVLQDGIDEICHSILRLICQYCSCEIVRCLPIKHNHHHITIKRYTIVLAYSNKQPNSSRAGVPYVLPQIEANVVTIYIESLVMTQYIPPIIRLLTQRMNIY